MRRCVVATWRGWWTQTGAWLASSRGEVEQAMCDTDSRLGRTDVSGSVGFSGVLAGHFPGQAAEHSAARHACSMALLDADSSINTKKPAIPPCPPSRPHNATTSSAQPGKQ